MMGSLFVVDNFFPVILSKWSASSEPYVEEAWDYAAWYGRH